MDHFAPIDVPPEKSGSRRVAVREKDQLTNYYRDLLAWISIELRATGGRGELTVHHYRAWTRRFFWFLQRRQVLLDDLADSHVKEWSAGYADKKPATRQSLAKALNTVLPLLHESGRLKTLPSPLRKLGSRTIVEPYILSDEEIQRLTAVIEPRRGSEKMTFVLLMSLIHTGLRVMELLTIRTDELRFANDGRIISVKVKRKWRMESFLPVSSVLDPIWREWLNFREIIRSDDRLRRNVKRSASWAQSEYLFPGVRGGHLTYSALYRIVKKIGHLASLPQLHPHLFRHYFGTTLHYVGAGVPEVMSLMGHRDMRSQAVYLHANMERQKAAIERYGSAVNEKTDLS